MPLSHEHESKSDCISLPQHSLLIYDIVITDVASLARLSFSEFPEHKFFSMIFEKDFSRFVWSISVGEEAKTRIGRMFAVCLFTSAVVSSLSLSLFFFKVVTLHSTMLPALRSRTNLNRVLTQTLAVIRQRESFRVPVQNSSAVSVLTDEQRAFNLKIWPGNQYSLSL